MLFSNPTLYTWFEMVTCRIDGENVTRFPRAERLPVHTVFSETDFKYDADFWGRLQCDSAGRGAWKDYREGLPEDRADGSSVNMALNRLRWVGCIFHTKIISILFFYCNFVPGISLNLKIVTMRLPEDPVMLYSFINMKLRDFYPSLDALCEDMNVEKEDIVRKLKLVGFEYNPAKNRFW